MKLLLVTCAVFSTFISKNYVSSIPILTEEIDQNAPSKYVTIRNLKADDISAHSMTLSWLPPIGLQPIKYKILINPKSKEYTDAQGLKQTVTFEDVEITLKPSVTSYTINELSPYTAYSMKITAIPENDSDAAPTNTIIVTTKMAAPNPMVKPDFYGVVNQKHIQVILPKVSDEYGPIKSYYLIVVPQATKGNYGNPDNILTNTSFDYDEMASYDPISPYVAAIFPTNGIPYTYLLGTGETGSGFINHPLKQGKKYRIFVRAVVDAQFGDVLYTTSPFSDVLSLDMTPIPSGEPLKRPVTFIDRDE